MQDRIVEHPVERRLLATADAATRQMATRLNLNEAQFVRLRAATAARLLKLDEVEWQYEQNSPERQVRIAELEAQYEQERQRILTPSQIVLLRDDERRDAVPQNTNPAVFFACGGKLPLADTRGRSEQYLCYRTQRAKPDHEPTGRTGLLGRIALGTGLHVVVIHALNLLL
jgi:hypothetical protein